MTSLTVSIVNHNGRDTLLPLLAALEGGDVVVLDNASEDGSVEAVRERFPRVRLIAQRHRAGFGANHNTVIGATSSRYVYVLNEDTTSEDWGLDRMVAHLDANPRVAALGPRLVYPDGRPQGSAWRFPSPAVAALGLLTLGRAGVKQSGGSAARDVDWVMGAAILLRREALEPLVQSFDAILMANHGVVTHGPDLMTAYYRMETVEHFAKISLVTELLGRQVLLSGSEVDKLLTARRSYFGASAPAIERTDVCPVTDGARESPRQVALSREDLEAMVERAVRTLKPQM